MSRHQSNAVAIPRAITTDMAAPRGTALSEAAETIIGEGEMHRLSRRLWTLEIHRRLEREARRLLAP